MIHINPEKLKINVEALKNLVYILTIIATLAGVVWGSVWLAFDVKIKEFTAPMDARVRSLEEFRIENIETMILKQYEKIAKGDFEDIKSQDIEDIMNYYHYITQPTEKIRIAYEAILIYYEDYMMPYAGQLTQKEGANTNGDGVTVHQGVGSSGIESGG